MSVDTAHRMMRSRNGSTLVVGIYVRSSSAYPERSLQEQEATAKKAFAGMYQGPVEYRLIATHESAESLDHQGRIELEALVHTRTMDLIVFAGVTRLGEPPSTTS